jgi:hypothetical protein
MNQEATKLKRGRMTSKNSSTSRSLERVLGNYFEGYGLNLDCKVLDFQPSGLKI